MDYTVTSEIKTSVLELIKNKATKLEIKKALAELTGWKDTKCYETIRKIVKEKEEILQQAKNEVTKLIVEEDQKVSVPNILECKDNYVYNPNTDQYVIPSKRVKNNNIVLHGDIIRGIIHDYTGNLTVNECARKYHIPRPVLEEILKKLGITHDSLPLTKEELQAKEHKEIVADMLELKKFEVLQAFEKEEWKDIQNNANKWIEFKHGVSDPILNFLQRWEPPKYVKVPHKLDNKKKESNKTFVIGLSDLHYGSCANGRYLFNRPGWSTEKTVEAVGKYADTITEEVRSRNYKFKKAVVLGLGDLIHSMDGKTARGTEIRADKIREEQFEFALDSMVAFLNKVIETFGEVEVHSVYGNHYYEMEMALFKSLEMYYRSDKRIKFYNYSTRPAAFKIDNTLFLIDHGADSKSRAYVPGAKQGIKREAHILNALVSKPELLQDVKSKIFCQGDKHHWENIEFNNFEFVMFSTIIGGDEYSASNGLMNRARQSCLVLDENGLKEILHCYFD